MWPKEDSKGENSPLDPFENPTEHNPTETVLMEWTVFRTIYHLKQNQNLSSAILVLSN